MHCAHAEHTQPSSDTLRHAAPRTRMAARQHSHDEPSSPAHTHRTRRYSFILLLLHAEGDRCFKFGLDNQADFETWSKAIRCVGTLCIVASRRWLLQSVASARSPVIHVLWSVVSGSSRCQAVLHHHDTPVAILVYGTSSPHLTMCVHHRI